MNKKDLNNDQIISITLKDKEIIAVPSKHFDCAYATIVNVLCCDAELRPDAIAVELNQSFVVEIAKWFTELGIGSQNKVELPVMLAVTQNNRILTPEKKEIVTLLETYFKTKIENIDSVLVSKVLESPDQVIVPISSTDSIIEGIRSSLEINVPVFGIDTLHRPSPRGTQLVLEDYIPGNNFKEFINNNKTLVHKLRGEDDNLREIAMARQLKGLRYKRILFVCGMAHFVSVVEKLKNDSILPLEILNESCEIETKRNILHPFLAVECFTYPIMSTIYERLRNHPSKNNPQLVIPDYEKIFRQIFNNAKEKYGSNHQNEQISIETFIAFEQLLGNMNLMNLRTVASMANIIHVSSSVFSRKFQNAIIESFMNIEREWASSEKFGLPLISPDFRNKRDSQYFVTINYKESNGKCGISDKHISTWYHGFTETNFKNDFQLEKDNDFKDYSEKNCSWWISPEKEIQLFLLGLQATKISANIEKHPILFEGSLQAGLAMKQTIRSFATGKFDVYVYSNKKKGKQNNNNLPQPVVFIFEMDHINELPVQHLYSAGKFIGKFVADRSKYQYFIKSGSIFIASISYLLKNNDGMDLLAGDLSYGGDPYLNEKMTASYLERTSYKCNPSLKNLSIKELNAFYLNNFKIEIGTNWTENLILYAIPYCFSKELTVVAPNNFKPTEKAITEARKNKVLIKIIPLTAFRSDLIQSVRERPLVRSTDDFGFFYPAFYGGFRKYVDLLPKALKNELEKINIDFAYLKTKEDGGNF